MKDQVVLIHVVDHYDVLLLNEVLIVQHHFDRRLQDVGLLPNQFFEHSIEVYVVD
jgi:hypothetical protein